MKRKQLIILSILVILVLIYVLARWQEPVEKEIRFFKADSVSLAKMVFVNQEDTIIVEKKGKDWKLTYPVLWDASTDQINSFFKQVLPIQTSSTTMSDEPTMQSLYKVDAANANQVKLYNKSGRLLDHAFIGNGGNSTFDYGRHEGSNKIYQLKDNIANLVKPDIYQWRSPNITNLRLNDLDHIDVSYTKNSYSLTIEQDSIRYRDKYNNFLIPQNNRAQWKIINALENLSTYQFIDQNTEKYLPAFQKPDCTIKVYLKDKTCKTFTLTREEKAITPIGTKSIDKEVTVLMMIDGKTSPLYQMTGDFINRFTRAPQHFQVEFD